MTTHRERTLQAASEAARIFDRFAPQGRTSFDIVRAITLLGFPIMFRPTKDLLGATVTVGAGARGILVTTKRGLAIQRFTLAHELGHLVLGHKLRFDLLTSDEVRWGPGGPGAQEERGADTFASELLAPRRLVSQVARRQKWHAANFRDPTIVYQLSLRLGLSFQATCWALARNRLLTEELARRISNETEVNQIKVALASPYELPDSWADVWAVTEADVGLLLECGPNDAVVLSVKDHASAGYLWDVEESDGGFEVVFEKPDITESYGAESSRVLLLRSKAAGNHRLVLRHKRPWSGELAASVEFKVTNMGKEVDGLPRYVKRELLNPASA